MQGIQFGSPAFWFAVSAVGWILYLIVDNLYSNKGNRDVGKQNCKQFCKSMNCGVDCDYKAVAAFGGEGK